MRVTTWNVNGLRAALRKGYATWIDTLKSDVVLLQEVRSTPDQLPDGWAAPDGWHVLWHPAEKLGYAGTSVWSRHPIEKVGVGLGDGVDPEGRVLRVRTAGVEVVSIYLPSGSSGPEKQANKELWMARFAPWAQARLADPSPVVMGGDFNIAHTEHDIHDPKGNAKNSGFLPHERAWFGELLATGWSDLVRADVGPGRAPYSWWSNRGQARALDRGWRIDYLLANAAFTERVIGTQTVRAAALEVSDHAPVMADWRP